MSSNAPKPVTMPIRLAQIGAGYWGPNLIRNFSQLDGLERLVVCDLDPERLGQIKKLYPHVETTTDCAAVFRDPSIDGIILATPARLHHAMGREALMAGKHLFVEKPLTRTLEEAEDLTRVAEERGLTLMVGHTFLYNAAVRKVKEYIDAGELGQIYYILAQRLNLGRVREDVNAWWNLAPHDVSIILYWLGELPSQVEAKGFTFLQDGIEDVVFANMNFPSGTAAHIHVSWLDPIKTRRIVVVGSKKMLVYDDVATEARIAIYDKGIDKKNIIRTLPDIESFGQFQFMHRTGDVLIPSFPFKEPLAEECRHFVQCITAGSRPLSDGRNGRDVVAVMEQAQNCLDFARSV